MTRTAINEDVTITALAFRNNRDFATLPKRMQYRGSTYTFMGGLQYLVKKGDDIMRIFDMSDDRNTVYRLRSDDTQSNWTLVAITEHA
jgi:hypothetical protein